MYQDPTHFLLELLQNADDNTYEDNSTPKLKITYRDGFLRLDANEAGFRRADVQAICSIGQSSKEMKRSQHKTKRIGEKGIGFKALFRVADEVFISSGFYSFKFDGSAPLGKITPIWASFPEERLKGFTSILLKLRQEKECILVVDQLRSFDSKVLMFLQKIKEIEIELATPDSDSTKLTLRREDVDSPYGEFEWRRLTPDHSSPYLILHYPVRGLPDDEKRPGCRESVLILAFPTIPFLGACSVYSFLPVRDYGFKIILQADFVLVANREEIESGSKWNKALLDHIPDAFLDAVKKFNRSDFRYRWPAYLPLRVERSDFFQGTWPKVKKRLSDAAVLESASGVMLRPPALVLIPSEISDPYGRSLVPPNLSKFKYLSSKYAAELSDALVSLGVRRLSSPDFLDDVSNFATNRPREFERMPARWHSRLSQVFDTLATNHKKAIASIRFVPLQSGEWVAPRAQPLLLPLESGRLVIPDDIDCCAVHPVAAGDPARMALLRRFQAKNLDEAEVCLAILRTHGADGFPLGSVDVADLIKHASFLYEAGWRRRDRNSRIWVATEGARHRCSKEVYLEHNCQGSASLVFGDERGRFPFLHADYYEVFQTEAQRDWLVEHLGLSVVPRLVDSRGGQADDFQLHNDFRFLINKLPALEVLGLLRSHWKFYSQWIAPTGLRAARGRAYDKLKAVFVSIMVPCRDGSRVPLRQTYLPRKEVLAAVSVVPAAEPAFQALQVPEPDCADWDMLQHFGVMCQVEIHHLLRLLERAKETGASKEQVAQLYGKLETYAAEKDIGLIMQVGCMAPSPANLVVLLTAL